MDAAPGTVTQVRGSAQALIRFAKKSGAAVILVGHVTKDGQIAGPRVVEHMVDAVMSFEGEGSHQFRILRAVKNRFGPTDEIGVFEMTGLGLREVTNPSELFLSERDLGSPGTAVFAGIEGTRPVLVEIQALVAPTTLGTPRRAVVGWDNSRLSMVLAVLQAHCGINLGGHDVYLNVAGGLAHQRARRRPGGRRGSRLLARQCAASGRRGLFRRGVAVGRGAPGGADRVTPEGGAEARLRPRGHARQPGCLGSGAPSRNGQFPGRARFRDRRQGRKTGQIGRTDRSQKTDDAGSPGRYTHARMPVSSSLETQPKNDTKLNHWAEYPRPLPVPVRARECGMKPAPIRPIPAAIRRPVIRPS